MKTIVVGIDGSDASLEALRWAVEEAELRHTKVVALHAWAVPQSVTAYGGVYITEAEVEAIRKGAHELLEAAVDEVAGEAPVEIVQIVMEGPAAAALVAAATDADLVVVGSRGLGGFKELLLGSVSHQVAHHAPCPVVVIRKAARHAHDEVTLAGVARATS